MSKRKITNLDLPYELKKPIEINDVEQKISLITSGSLEGFDKEYQDLQNKNSEYVEGEVLKKLKILAEFFQVDINAPDGWMLLSGHLAFNFIPGFQVVKKAKKGPKEKWNSYIYFQLWYEVRQKMRELSTNEFDACEKLSKMDPWDKISKRVSKQQAHKTLYNHYLDTKNDPFVKVMGHNLLNLAEERTHEYEQIIRQLYEDFRESKSGGFREDQKTLPHN